MKIIVCASVSAADEVLDAKRTLESMGHEVEIPTGIKDALLRKRTEVSSEEKASDKIAHDVIRDYFEKMKRYDAVLIVNPPKRGVEGYIGGNTLIEMAFAHVLGKKLYALHPLPDLPYASELLATQPIILSGDLSAI